MLTTFNKSTWRRNQHHSKRNIKMRPKQSTPVCRFGLHVFYKSRYKSIAIVQREFYDRRSGKSRMTSLTFRSRFQVRKACSCCRIFLPWCGKQKSKRLAVKVRDGQINVDDIPAEHLPLPTVVAGSMLSTPIINLQSEFECQYYRVRLL
jgi:hypothetical protein